MSKLIVLYTEIGKQSASILAEALKADMENPYQTKNRDFTNYDYVFKFGFSKPIKSNKTSVFNRSKPTQIAIDKLKTFLALQGLGVTVEYTTDLQTAVKWIKDGHYLVARGTNKGSNGEGLSYIQTEAELNNTPSLLWTKLVDEVQEIRVYLWKDKVLSIYVKEINNDGGVFNFKLIKEDDSYKHPQLLDLVDKVYKNVGLDFCGIDIITDTSGKLNLLEVNSSPILFPYTLKRLVKNIMETIAK